MRRGMLSGIEVSTGVVSFSVHQSSECPSKRARAGSVFFCIIFSSAFLIEGCDEKADPPQPPALVCGHPTSDASDFPIVEDELTVTQFSTEPLAFSPAVGELTLQLDVEVAMDDDDADDDGDEDDDHNNDDSDDDSDDDDDDSDDDDDDGDDDDDTDDEDEREFLIVRARFIVTQVATCDVVRTLIVDSPVGSEPIQLEAVFDGLNDDGMRIEDGAHAVQAIASLIEVEIDDDEREQEIEATIATGQIVFLIDAAAPVVQIVEPVDGSNLKQSEVFVEIVWADPAIGESLGSGIDVTTAVVEFDGQDIRPQLNVDALGARGVVASVPDGSHQLTVRITDLAGNSAETASLFMVDTEPPTITLERPTKAQGGARFPVIDDMIELGGTVVDDQGLQDLTLVRATTGPAPLWWTPDMRRDSRLAGVPSGKAKKKKVFCGIQS